AHHHARPVSAAKIPHSTVGSLLRSWPESPSASAAERGRAFPALCGITALAGTALIDGARRALMTIRCAAEYFGLPLVSGSSASGVLLTTETSVGATINVLYTL